MAELERRFEQEQKRQPPCSIEAEEFESLAGELEKIWNHPDTDARLKKRIVRTLIEEVLVDVRAEAGEILVTVHCQGGVHSELRVPR